MFAVVANGIATVCKTQRMLDYIMAVYPYPKFKKCDTHEEAVKWLSENSRDFMDIAHKHYGETANSGYVRIEYFIAGNNIYYNVYTDKVGYIKVPQADGVLVESRPELLKIKVINVKLNNANIMHHTIAIRRILKLLGDFVDVDILVPDISIFLALTKYTGKNYAIRGVQDDINRRLGAVSITVKNCVN